MQSAFANIIFSSIEFIIFFVAIKRVD